MVFELDAGGHRAGYVENLIRYWQSVETGGHLFIVTSLPFADLHPDVMSLEKEGRVSFVITSATEAGDRSVRAGESALRRTAQALRDWQTLCRYARRLRADHCLVLFFDRLLQVAAMGRLRPPCDVSGIFFRPMFHYRALAGHGSTWFDHIKALRQRLVVGLAIRRSWIRTVFTLDPYILEGGRPQQLLQKFVHIGDPVRTYETPPGRAAELRQEFGVAPNRTVFLLFGELTRRKGVDQVLQALSLLHPSVANRTTVMLLGPLANAYRSQIQAITAAAGANGPQIIGRDMFVRDRDIQQYFEMADVVVACYRRHVGMSALLVRAAMAEKPVLASDFGALGETVRRHCLGVVVDSTSSAVVATGMAKFLSEEAEHLCDTAKMKAFARNNTPEDFAGPIFRAMGLPARASR